MKIYSPNEEIKFILCGKDGSYEKIVDRKNIKTYIL